MEKVVNGGFNGMALKFWIRIAEIFKSGRIGLYHLSYSELFRWEIGPMDRDEMKLWTLHIGSNSEPWGGSS